MPEVVCWCCKYFDSFEELKIYRGKFVNGRCLYKDLMCLSEDKVCEEFILRSGLYTQRTIPDFCKNHKK